MHFERRKPKWYQWMMQFIVPGIILALVAWSANKQVVTGEKQAATAEKVEAINTTVQDIRKTIDLHSQDSIIGSMKNAKLHHRASMMKCANCHDDNGGN